MSFRCVGCCSADGDVRGSGCVAGHHIRRISDDNPSPDQMHVSIQ